MVHTVEEVVEELHTVEKVVEELHMAEAVGVQVHTAGVVAVEERLRTAGVGKSTVGVVVVLAAVGGKDKDTVEEVEAVVVGCLANPQTISASLLD